MTGHRLLPGLRRANLLRELTAGLTLLAISVPLNIGYAQIAGLPPTAGLYALVVPTLVFALVASSRQLVVAPDAAGAALVASSLGGLVAADAAGYAAMAAAQAVIGGLLFFVAARFRLGFIADFLSRPILIGFVGGLALDIMVSQLAKMLGVPLPGGAEFLGKSAELLAGLGAVGIPSLLLSLGCLGVFLVGRRLARAVPWALVVMVGATLVSTLFDLPSRGVAVLGEVPAGPPQFGFPSLELRQWSALIPSSLALTAVTIAEGLMIARKYAEKNDHSHDPDRELVALGAANIAAGLSSSFTVGASTSRTAAMDDSGSRTQLPAIVLAVGAAALLLFGTGLLAGIPSPAIGAIVAVAVARLVGIGELRELWRLSRAEFAVASICFIGVLVVGPINGIAVAFVLAVVNLARRAALPVMEVLADPAHPEISLLDGAEERTETVPGVVVFRLAAPIFFANATAVARRLTNVSCGSGRQTRAVVLDLEGVTDVDVTGAGALDRALARLDDQGIVVAFSRQRTRLAARMTQLGVRTPVRVFDTNREALAALRVAAGHRSGTGPPDRPGTSEPVDEERS